MLILGGLGPILGLISRLISKLPPGSPLGPPTTLDIGLGILCVLLSCFLYALVAYLTTRRIGNRYYGLWAALLAAFTAILVSSVTAVLIDFSPLLTGSSEIPPINYLISCKGLLLVAMVLGISQLVHAVIGGLIGLSLASSRSSTLSHDQ